MKKVIKKFTTILLAMIMGLSFTYTSYPVYAQENIKTIGISDVPTENSVAQVGDTYYENLLEAINASSTENPAIMLKDIKDSSSMFAIENKNSVLNTNGFTLEFVATPYNRIVLNPGQTLTINGSGNKDKPDLIVDQLEVYGTEDRNNNSLFLNDVYLKKASSNYYQSLLSIKGDSVLKDCIIDFNPKDAVAVDYQLAIFVNSNIQFQGNNKVIGSIELFTNGTETTQGTLEMVNGTIKKTLSRPNDLEGCKGEPLNTIVLPEGWVWVNPSETLEPNNDFIPFATKKVRYLIRDNYDYSHYDGYNKDGKYVDVDVDVIIILFNRNEWLIEPSMSDWIYGEQASAPKGQPKFGKVEFSYKAEKDDAYSTNVPSEPGNYFMRAYVGKCYGDGHDEYKEIEVVIPFTIHKITPTITLPNNIIAFEGDLLSTVPLPDGFTWKDESKIVDHSGVYDAIYTPDDTEHYKTLEVKINIFMYDRPIINVAPTIQANDITLTVGDRFDPLKDVTATDKEDGSNVKLEVIKNTVDTTKAGTYEIVYKATDSNGVMTTKTIKVTVNAKNVILPDTDTNSSNTNSPETGDQTNLGLFTSLLTVSGLGIAVLAILNKKKALNK